MTKNLLRLLAIQRPTGALAIQCHSLPLLFAPTTTHYSVCATLYSLLSTHYSLTKKTATHPCSGLLSAHAPQHLLLRLLSTLLKVREYMYALQKHSAKIAFFYLIKKSPTQFFQQFIVVPGRLRFPNLQFTRFTRLVNV